MSEKLAVTPLPKIPTVTVVKQTKDAQGNIVEHSKSVPAHQTGQV